MNTEVSSNEIFTKSKSTLVRSLNLDIALSTCGWSITDLKANPPKDKYVLVSVARWGNIKPIAIANKVSNNTLCERYTKRIISLDILRSEVAKLIDIFQPDFIVTEDTFMGSFPSAYAALEQAITSVALMCYDNYRMPLYRIPTKNAKQAVTNSGASKKASVLEHIVSSDTIVFKQKALTCDLDHHSADSIAVGYDFLTRVYPDLCRTVTGESLCN